jgi:diadenosine tetraphosphate (Ap4A) HIT family hydrolase
VADCLFCKIANKEVDAEIVHESDDIMAFRDINPVAPTHILVITKEHIESADNLTRSHGGLLGEMFEAMASMARSEGAGRCRGHRDDDPCSSDRFLLPAITLRFCNLCSPILK